MTENNVDVTESASTEIVAPEDMNSYEAVQQQIENFAEATGSIYTTVAGDDPESKLKIFGAITGAERIDEVLNDTIPLVDFIIQAIEVADLDSGELNATTRVTLIDKDGNAYAGISQPLVNSLQMLTQIMGHPTTWTNPVDVVVEEITTRRGFKAFNLVPASMSKKNRKKK